MKLPGRVEEGSSVAYLADNVKGGSQKTFHQLQKVGMVVRQKNAQFIHGALVEPAQQKDSPSGCAPNGLPMDYRPVARDTILLSVRSEQNCQL